MKKLLIAAIALASGLSLSAQAPKIPHSEAEDTHHIMSHQYWNIWNAEEQARIDADIDAYRKADAVFKTGKVRKGTQVKVEQISSEFVFGASAFNWNQLGSKKANARYRETFGTLFNRATIPFYWKDFEMNPGNMRFAETKWDTEQWWAKQTAPKFQPHWRRPATDPIVDYCEAHGVAVHGHPLVWGSRKWQFPRWVQIDGIPEQERRALDTLEFMCFNSSGGHADSWSEMTPARIAELVPTYIEMQERAVERRVSAIMSRYEGRISSWDIVNESAVDYFRDSNAPDSPMLKSNYGLLYTDYTYKAFKYAEPLDEGHTALFNINDYWVKDDTYLRQVKDLVARGCRIDVVGSQMHLFDPRQCLDIAAGTYRDSKLVNPEPIRKFFAELGSAGIPTCLSEITITSAGDGFRGEMIQAIIARNLYRIWFSLPSMMGITWWNVVDDCGAAGEPTISGIYHRDMTPKAAYFALDELINHEWRTSEELTPDSKGNVSWRGFKGKYRITWIDRKGVEHVEYFEVNQ